MAKYKVKVIAMLVRGNKMVNHGEVVDTVNLLTPAEELVSKGFIEPITSAAPKDEEDVVIKKSKNK